ncbi:MAG: prepilin-type N-terminal cleavage/methylation domain-containing protein [Candidatus Omnitrophota bacterium]
MRKNSGFTLTELIVAVVVLGILATLGYSGFHVQRRRGELRSAIAQVQAIVAAEQLYFLTFRAYRATTNTATTNSQLGLKIQDAYFRNYRVSAGAGSFTIGVNGGNAVYTFNASGNRTGCSGSDCVS